MKVYLNLLKSSIFDLSLLVSKDAVLDKVVRHLADILPLAILIVIRVEVR